MSSASSAATAGAAARSSPPLDAAQRQGLLQQKLRALVAGHWQIADPALGPFPGGAVARHGDAGWVLAGERAGRALGGALAWARQAGVSELHVLADEGAGALARRAAAFARPPAVWQVVGRDLAPAEPEPLTAEPPLTAAVEAYLPVIAGAGADAVVEGGVLLAEVLGLEVGRVVDEDGAARLEVGVGAFDREAQRLVHADRPPAEALASAVDAVRRVRRPDAPAHQVNQLAAERWLRWVLVRRPELVGAARLEPVPSPVVRTDLRQSAPAPAAGVDREGRPMVVVCSTGIDVELVPAAVDARLADGRGARLVLALPEADDHPLTRALAAALAQPAEVVVVEGDWRQA
ncbi:MAG TPA: hypothetical protein VFJ85_15380 [Acidimicrobiales bacterium]|nr:hypothetical protein [Acidimicrobiales bacterium]